MTSQSDVMAETPDAGAARRTMSATRPFCWSVRRELWETRSIYVAPLAVAAVVLLALLIGAITQPHGVRALASLDPARQAATLAQAYGFAAFPISVTGFIVAVFYCLGALHNERRDRSILFWKSLPVSDLTSVLAKASIPLVVLPLVIMAIIIVLRLIMLVLGSAILLANGLSAAPLWTHLPLLQLSVVPLYGTVVEALWYAPIYGWLLLVSGWARRAPFLWAVLPPLGIVVFEKIAFNSTSLLSLLGYRLAGSDTEAFAANSGGKDVIWRLAQLDPAKFLGTPGLWAGLAVAAAFIAAAVWMRRRREPI
ncbi:MAG: hypothetical protein ABI306_08570 [Caulobacteraceae bacterium]